MIRADPRRRRHRAADRARDAGGDAAWPSASMCWTQGRMIAEGTPADDRARPGGHRGLSRPRRAPRRALRWLRRCCRHGLRAGYGAIEVLRGVDLDVGDGRDRRAARQQRRRQDRRSTTCLRPLPARRRRRSASTASRLAGACQPRIVERRPDPGAGRTARLPQPLRAREPASSAPIAAAAPERAARNLERVLAIFPRLRERCASAPARCRGGEQQMLAIGRGLMARAAPADPRRAVARPVAAAGRGDVRADRAPQRATG